MTSSFVLGAEIGAALTLLAIGALMAWTSGNILKRVVGIVIADLGALLALATLGAPASMLIAGIGAAFAALLVGIALIVRLQESYGGVEALDFDAADQNDEPAEPAA